MKGKTVSHFRILNLLGRGGMGVVYKAEDLRLDRLVALKFLPDRLSRDDHIRERFIREAKAVSAFDHPNICTIYEIDDSPEGLFIAMAYYEGETLKDRIRRTRLAVREAIEIVVQILSGLSQSHAKGIVHRDVKPANILLPKDGPVKILDFGLAKLRGHSQLTRTDAILGTAAYMAPEQVRSEKVGAPADIWAIGVMLHQMLTGSLPFKGASEAALMYSILRDDPVPVCDLRKDVSEDLSDLISWCLEKRPGSRISGAVELRNRLADLIGADGGLTLRLGDGARSATDLGRMSRRLRRFGRRRKMLLVALVFASLLAAMAVTLHLSRGTQGAEDWGSGQFRVLVTWAGSQENAQISPDGSWISFISQELTGASLWAAHIGGGEPVPVVPPSLSILSHVWSPDGTRIAYTSEHSTGPQIKIIPAFGGPIEESHLLAVEFQEAKLLRWVDDTLFLNGHQSLYRMDLGSGEIEAVLSRDSPEGTRGQFDIRPDGEAVAFRLVGQGRHSVWWMDWNGEQAHRVSPEDVEGDRPYWIGSEGESLIYSSYQAGQSNLWRVDGGGPPRQITFSNQDEFVESVFPDGRLIVFQASKVTADLWLVDNQENATQLTADSQRDSFAAAIPDGGKVVFQRSRLTGAAIRTLENRILVGRLENGDLASATEVVGDGFGPELSPDGRWLTFSRSVGGKYALWIMDLESGHSQVVTETIGIAGLYQFPVNDWTHRYLAWTVDSEALFFVDRSGLSSDRVVRLEPERMDRTTVVEASAAGWIGDLLIDDASTRLAYVREAEDVGSQVRVVGLDPDATDRVIWRHSSTETGSLYLVDWLDSEDGVLVLETLFNSDWSERIEVLRFDLNGGKTRLGIIESGFAGTSRLRESDQVLFLVGRLSPENGQDLLAFSTATGETRAVTNNNLPGVGFGSIELLSSGGILVSKNTENADLWLIEYAD